jgi:hypothetical protein
VDQPEQRILEELRISPVEVMQHRTQSFTCILIGMLAAGSAQATDLDRGHSLLLQYGYQLHAAPSPALAYRNPNGIDSTNLTVWRNAGFNGLNFESMNWDQQMWTPPTGNYNWSRWDLPSVNPSNPSYAGLMMLSVWDEQWLGDPYVLSTVTTRLANIRASAPHIIGYVNDAGVTNTLAEIKNYMAVAQPDMLSFDRYVFAFGDPWPGGSPTQLYDAMGKYRTAGLAGNNGDFSKPIPYAMWYQAFKVPGGATLSESEFTLQYGAAWTYGYKALKAFRYSNEAATDPLYSVLFNGPNDTNPTPLYTTVSRLNRQTQNLAPALLRLKSVNLQFVRGQHKQGLFTVSNDLPEYATPWSASSSGDPYMTAITVTNVGNSNGTPKKNNGLRGDVIVGYFKPLLEEFDGSTFNNQLYFMITNGLTDAVGDSFDTRQQVRLNFNFGTSGINSLQRLDRDSGQVVTVPLTSIGGGNFYLDWILSGGEGDLFKYNTGAPFVGRVASVWGGSSGGDWHNSANWNNGLAPNGIGEAAELGGIITASRTVFADTPVTLGTLTFNSVRTYNLTGIASLTIESTTGAGAINAMSGSHRINLPLTFASDTSVLVATGATLTLADPVTIKAGKTVTQLGVGSLLLRAPLTIESGATLAMSGAAMSVTGAPSLAPGARIDVGGEELEVVYGGIPSPAQSVHTLLTTGYSGGNWTGDGIMTSLGSTAQGLGWVDDVVAGVIKVRLTSYGDADLSGTVDSIDFAAMLAGFGAMGGAVWSDGDFNYDGKVSTLDFNQLAGNFGALSPQTGIGAVVPEPTAAGLIGIVPILLARLSRRNDQGR